MPWKIISTAVAVAVATITAVASINTSKLGEEVNQFGNDIEKEIKNNDKKE